MTKSLWKNQEEKDLELHSNVRIQSYTSRLFKLREYLDWKVEFKEEEVCAWVAACVDLFVEIGLHDQVIEWFMKTFEFEPDKWDLLSWWQKHHIWPLPKAWSIYNLYRHDIFSNPPSERVYYAKIAFNWGKAAIKRMAEEEVIVPKWLIQYFKNREDKYQNISSSIQLIDKALLIKDGDSLLKNTVGLLENILDLEVTLQWLDLSKKLKQLDAKEELRNKFWIQKEFVFALNNSRLVRNAKIIHKTRPIKYEIPFLVAITCAYLGVMLLEFTIAQWELIS